MRARMTVAGPSDRHQQLQGGRRLSPSFRGEKKLNTRLLGTGIEDSCDCCILRCLVAGPDTRLEILGIRRIKLVQQKAPSHTGEEGGRWMKSDDARTGGALYAQAEGLSHVRIKAPR